MIEVMMTLFALVVVGYVAGKLGYLGGDFDRQLSRLVINITCPALILSSAMTGTLPDRRFILPLLLISVITYIILTGVAFLFPRYLTKKKADEGPIGFAVSRRCVKCILDGGRPWVSIDLKPGVEEDDLLVRIKGLWDEIGKDPRSRALRIPATARVLLGKLMPRELEEAFLQAHPAILSGRRGNERLDFRALAAALKDWRLHIDGYVGYERCVITAGGVCLDEVLPKTMESRLRKGLKQNLNACQWSDIPNIHKCEGSLF